MPKHLVTLHERIARTYSVEANDTTDAIHVGKGLLDPDKAEVDVEWVDFCGDPDPDYDVILLEPIDPPEEDVPDENF